LYGSNKNLDVNEKCPHLVYLYTVNENNYSNNSIFYLSSTDCATILQRCKNTVKLTKHSILSILTPLTPEHACQPSRARRFKIPYSWTINLNSGT
jgi:hypothetical protein